jgi:hypothetical protein
MAKKTTTKVIPPKEWKIEQVDVKKLLLDVQNPRFASGLIRETQDDLLKMLWDEFAVDEVALSIAANGYFPEEPLFVVPEEGKTLENTQHYIVVEGNRRLAAVRLLLEDQTRAKLKATNLPKISGESKQLLATLPVSKHKNRTELWRYLGFRHINGPQPWDSFSKAVYIAGVHDTTKVPLDDIAESIGDLHSTVKRLYRGYTILRQAERMTSFRRDDIWASKLFFSHLYTAMDQAEYLKFIGLEPRSALRPNPVPKAKMAELEELMMWFYGSKAAQRPPLIKSQNPDLNILRETISSARGLAAIRAGFQLQRSYEISIGDARRFRNAITRAKEELQTADGTVTTGYDGQEDLYLIFADILTITASVEQRMGAKRTQRATKTGRAANA